MAPQLKFLKCASSFSSKPKQDAAIEFTQHCYQLHRLVSYFIRSTQLGLVKKNLVWIKKKNTSISLLYGVVDHGNHCTMDLSSALSLLEAYLFVAICSSFRPSKVATLYMWGQIASAIAVASFNVFSPICLAKFIFYIYALAGGKSYGSKR